jgi:hypothetical protein
MEEIPINIKGKRKRIEVNDNNDDMTGFAEDIEALLENDSERTKIIETIKKHKRAILRLKRKLQLLDLSESSINEDKDVVFYDIKGNQFTTFNGEVACTAISLACIDYFISHSEEMKHPSTFPWKDILNNGAAAWKRWNLKPHRNAHDYQHINEAIQHMSISCKLVSDHGGKVGTTTGEEWLSLTQILEKIDKDNNIFGCVITVCNKSISLFVNREDKWFLYDSHMHSFKSGYSTLIEFKDKSLVASYIKKNYSNSSDSVYSIAVFTK